VTFSPFAHVPSGAVPSPPPSTITVTGRAITTHSPTACLAAALAMPAEWARVDATISEHCPDAVSARWQPCAGWGLGLWCVHVRTPAYKRLTLVVPEDPEDHVTEMARNNPEM